MDHRLVIDGNAVYEIDQDCVRRQRERQERQAPGYGDTAGRYRQAPGYGDTAGRYRQAQKKNGYGRSR